MLTPTQENIKNVLKSIILDPSDQNIEKQYLSLSLEDRAYLKMLMTVNEKRKQ